MNWKIAAVDRRVITREENGRGFEPSIGFDQIGPENIWLYFVVEPAARAARKYAMHENQHGVGIVVAIPGIIFSRSQNRWNGHF